MGNKGYCHFSWNFQLFRKKWQQFFHTFILFSRTKHFRCGRFLNTHNWICCAKQCNALWIRSLATTLSSVDEKKTSQMFVVLFVSGGDNCSWHSVLCAFSIIPVSVLKSSLHKTSQVMVFCKDLSPFLFAKLLDKKMQSSSCLTSDLDAFQPCTKKC